MSRPRIAIAMSGGVDSSVAALMLKEAGYEVVGFSLRLWDPGRSRVEGDHHLPRPCCSLDDFRDAQMVAAQLGIAHYVVDFQSEFESAVVLTFIEEYRSGLTPSPCVLCNSRIKFGHLMRLAEEVGADRVATGHYARVSYDADTGRYLLGRALDRRKDQSYFLFELDQSQLARIVFPLGDLEKRHVRKIARAYKLPVAEKGESQEICFIPDGNYAAFIERNCRSAGDRCDGLTSLAGGQIVDREGRILGAHPGIHYFTVGQRRGLGIAHSKPLYVLEIQPQENRIVVGERSQLFRQRCRLGGVNWISIDKAQVPVKVHAKIRSQHAPAPATVYPGADGSVEVVFDNPQAAITPGQACVFYQDDKVVGGGWIQRD